MENKIYMPLDIFTNDFNIEFIFFDVRSLNLVIDVAEITNVLN